jgi:hypothetical protein
MNLYQPKISCKLHPVLTAFFAVIIWSGTTLAQDPGGRRMGRIASPAVISCDRNQLTSWTGAVSGYRRQDKSTWLEISTDEQTVEQTTIEHDGAADASAHYLLRSEPFTQADWPAIETAPGKLIDGVRATAWICLDGRTPPVIDWQPQRN